MASNTKNKNNQKKVNNNKKSNSNITKSEKTLVSKKHLAEKEVNRKNSFIMKILVVLGVTIFCFVLVYLMYHFFVEKSDIKINMSTDKQMEYITLEGEEELIITQKFVSDLSYSMRYDVNEFKVFKYKSQDIYKNLNDERVLVVVEKSTLPTNCTEATSQTEYNNCYVKVDDYTENHYISLDNQVYKITIKTPNSVEYEEGIKARINHMLKTFVITN